MGDEVRPRGWWIVEQLCRLLEQDDRDAVCGDLLESHARPGRALREVSGLVVRRQAALWLDWHPWFAVATIVLPLGFLLSVTSRWFADLGASHFLLYIRTGDWAYFAVPGWRHDVIAAAVDATLRLFALGAWSWTTGFVLGRVSHRVALAIGLVFCAVVAAGTLGSTTTVRMHGNEVSAIELRPMLITAVVRVVLVLLPAWRGFRRSRRADSLRLLPALAAAASIAVLTLTVARGLEGSLTFGYGLILPPAGPDHVIGTTDDPRPFWWLSFVMIWPALFMLMTAWRHRRARA